MDVTVKNAEVESRHRADDQQEGKLTFTAPAHETLEIEVEAKE